MQDLEDMVVPWHHWFSTGVPGSAAMAPHAALAEIGVDYQLVELDRDQAQTDAAYRALNPLGVVPTLVAGDVVVSESAAILLYLADRFPEARLAPDDRAELYRWLVFMTNTMQTCMLRFFYPERYGGGEVEDVAAAEADRLFDLVEESLEGRDWLVGDQRTAADLFLFMLTRWGRRLEPAAWERPRLRAHFLPHARPAGRPPDDRGARPRSAGLGDLARRPALRRVGPARRRAPARSGSTHACPASGLKPGVEVPIDLRWCAVLSARARAVDAALSAGSEPGRERATPPPCLRPSGQSPRVGKPRSARYASSSSSVSTAWCRTAS